MLVFEDTVGAHSTRQPLAVWPRGCCLRTKGLKAAAFSRKAAAFCLKASAFAFYLLPKYLLFAAFGFYLLPKYLS